LAFDVLSFDEFNFLGLADGVEVEGLRDLDLIWNLGCLFLLLGLLGEEDGAHHVAAAFLDTVFGEVQHGLLREVRQRR